MFAPDDLDRLVASASTLPERLAGGCLSVPGRLEDPVVSARLDAWRQVVSSEGPEDLALRLGWDDLDIERLRPLLGVVRRPDGATLPSWARLLSEAVDAAGTGRGHRPSPAEPILDNGSPVPFEEVLVPFLQVARERLTSRADGAYRVLTHDAHASLERYLLERLAFISAYTLQLEFSIQRAERRSSLEHLLAAPSGEPGRGEYQRFVERMLDGHLATLFCDYPVLGRLLALVTEQWIETTLEFLERLSRDWPGIQQAFGGKADLGRVTAIAPGLSDPHRGGRSALALTFASGRRLVYKPKDLGVEQAFQRVLVWLNELGAPLPFKTLTVVPRPGYGWVEFVPHEPCQTREEAERFYRRAGMLLCLVHALAGMDGHRENLIASGEHPVLVDMESLMHATARLQPEPQDEWVLVRSHLAESVLTTGLLPDWQHDEDEELGWDVSGLHTVDPQELVLRAPRWEHVNTDGMRLGTGTVELSLPASQPLLGDTPLRLDDHATDLLDGFERFYRFLLAHRAALLAPHSPISELGQQQVRFIHRNTRVYGQLHQMLCNPRYLRDGVDRSIGLELLARAAVQAVGLEREQPCWWPLVADEQEQMEQMDIPIFTARADEDVLTLSSGRRAQGCLRESGWQRTLRRLNALGEADLEWQRTLVASSLCGPTARSPAPRPSTHHTSSTVGLHRSIGEASASDSLEVLAMEIAAQIRARAIRASDGTATWIGPQYLESINGYRLQPLAFDLNGGTCGVALFLAAVERVTGGAGYRDLVLGALDRLRHSLRNDGNTVADELGVGGGTGLGSVIYTLTRVGQYLGEPSLLDDARIAAGLLDDERLDCAPVDVFIGVAGAMLGLLALHEVAPEPWILQRAEACGQYLLKSRTASAGGCRAWATLQGNLLTGFSHGAAGIAYALLRLFAATDRVEYRDAATEAILYENSLFDPAVENWLDLRAPSQPTCQVTWCHGAPGIGLGRLGGLSILDTERMRADAEAAVRTTLRVSLGGLDHLCCGNLGRTDLLIVAAQRLGRLDLADAALASAEQVARRVRTTRTFALEGGLPIQATSLSFFQGLSGIGYQLLRLTHPDRLPSALLWE